MKKLAYLAAIAASIAAAPAYAEGGYLGVSYSVVDAGSLGDDRDVIAVNGAAMLGEHVQIDAAYANIDGGDADNVAVSAHLFSRNDRFLWGAYVGFDTTSEAFTGSGVGEWSAGIEGQLYLDRATLTAAAGYTEVDLGGGSEAWTADIEGRYFVTDNFSIQGNVGYAEPESGVIIGDGWVGGVGAEYQFSGMPISIYGGWQHLDFSGLPDERDAIGVGVRYSWNATLFERNRAGPGLHRPQGLFDRIFGAPALR